VTGAPGDLRALGDRIVVIVNRAASRLRGPASGDRIVAEVETWAMEASGRPPSLVDVGDRASVDAAGAAARRAGSGLVVVVGGDGTVSAVAVALADSGIPLAIVPAGAGNVLATALGVPADPSGAIRSLAGAHRRRIDLGNAALRGPTGRPSTDRGFAVAAGVGWDARVMEATAAADKRRLGRLAYWVAALGLLGRLTPVPYRIEIDGERLELEATVALVANAGELVPGLVRPRLPIVPDDGLLDLLVLRVGSIPGGVRGALELLGRTELGGTPSGTAFRARGRRIRVVADPAQPRQVDGDAVGSGAIEVTVRPAALEVLVP
jgi:diacylglycerol kinase family enzyme